MTTVINNPGENNSNGGGAGSGVVIGAVIVVLVLIAVVVLSLPYIRAQISAMSNPGNPTINVQLPNNIQLPSLPASNTSSTTK